MDSYIGYGAKEVIFSSPGLFSSSGLVDIEIVLTFAAQFG